MEPGNDPRISTLEMDRTVVEGVCKQRRLQRALSKDSEDGLDINKCTPVI